MGKNEELYDAAGSNDVGAIHRLLAGIYPLRAKLNWRNRQQGGDTPLHNAARRGRVAAVRALLGAGASITALNLALQTPLDVAVSSGHADVVRALLAVIGADVRAKSQSHNLPLHVAVARGYVEVVRALVEGGVDVTARNKEGLTPLQVAAENGSVEVVRAMMEASVDSERPLAVSRLLPSLVAAGDVEVVRVLLEAGADVEALNSAGQTSLLVAASCGYIDMVQVLLAAGAHVATRDKEGQTPLHKAASGGHVAVILALLDAGADVAAQDKLRRKPVDVAASAHSIEAVDVLQAVAASKADQDIVLGVRPDVRGQDGASSSNATYLDDRGQCIVCMVAPREYAMVPCGHCLYCQDCAAVVAVRKTCAMCRQPVKHSMRVYLD